METHAPLIPSTGQDVRLHQRIVMTKMPALSTHAIRLKDACIFKKIAVTAMPALLIYVTAKATVFIYGKTAMTIIPVPSTHVTLTGAASILLWSVEPERRV